MNITDLSVARLSALLKRGEISALEAADAYLREIERSEPRLRAFITVTAERAREQAREIDRRRASGEALGPLAGVPMALKDNICTEGIRTTCASRLLRDFVPPFSAGVAERLEHAGAVLLGKTNMDEFAMGSTTQTSFFGGTENPAALGYVPGGSSGGSAAAVAAHEAAFALGSDTGGSIRQPAAFCGVVGLKPTYGTVTRYGAAELASSLDQIGPLTRTALDCAMVTNVLAGHDPRDATSLVRDYPDFTSDASHGVKGMRIALVREFFGSPFAEEVQRSVLRAAEVFRILGAETEEVSAPVLTRALPAYYIISTAEASGNLARYDGVRYGRRAENVSDSEALMRLSRGEGFGAEVKRRILLGTFVLDGENRERYFEKAMKVRTLVVSAFREIFSRFDLILAPTTPTVPYRIEERDVRPETRYLSDICAVPASLAGLPALSMPFGRDSAGLPAAVQLIAPAFGEREIFRAACALEREEGKDDAGV